jgi:hypothetical protein
MDDLENLITIDTKISSDEIFKHLCFISDLLEQHKIKYWIAYGTLLGSIRQNDIIPYDYDFDLGILYEDYPKVLELNPLISSTGYALEKGTGTVYEYNNFKKCEYKWRVSIKIKFNNDPVADLYIYEKFDDGFLRRYDKEEKIYFYPNSTFPYKFIETLIKSTIRDKEFPCPCDAEVLLEHFYGPLWKTHIKALSQDGPGHPDYDFYGSYINSHLGFLVDHIRDKFGVELCPDISLEDIKYLFPFEQKDWVKRCELNHKGSK